MSKKERRSIIDEQAHIGRQVTLGIGQKKELTMIGTEIRTAAGLHVPAGEETER